MTFTLTKDNFVNNIFTQLADSGCTFIFNSTQEHLKVDDNLSCIIDAISIQVYQDVGDTRYYTDCTNIIGMEDAFIKIISDFPEVQGQRLKLENLDKCVITLSDKALKEL